MKSSDNTLLLAGLFVLIVVIIALIVYYTRPGETKTSDQTSDPTKLTVENLTFERTLNPDPSVGDGVSGYTIEPYGVEYANPGTADYVELSKNVTFTMIWDNAPGFTDIVKGFEIIHYVGTTEKNRYKYESVITTETVNNNGELISFSDFGKCTVKLTSANWEPPGSVVGQNKFKLFAIRKADVPRPNALDLLYDGTVATGTPATFPIALKISESQLSVTLSMTTPLTVSYTPQAATGTSTRAVISKTIYDISNEWTTLTRDSIGIYLQTVKDSNDKQFYFQYEDGNYLLTNLSKGVGSTANPKLKVEIVNRETGTSSGQIKQVGVDKYLTSLKTGGTLKLYKTNDANLNADIFKGFKWTFNQRISKSLVPNGQNDFNQSDHNEKFGQVVCVSGDDAFVGQPSYNSTGDDPQGGRVHIYRRNDAGVWEFQKMITSSMVGTTPSSSREFGCSISISGDYAVIGERNFGQGQTTKVGRVYIIKKDTGGDWNSSKNSKDGPIAWTLPASSPEYGNAVFGNSVAISGKYIVVGAPGNLQGGNKYKEYKGTVHLYKIANTTWASTEAGKIRIEERGYVSGKSEGEKFGYAVDISGNRVIVGAPKKGLVVYDRACGPDEKIDHCPNGADQNNSLNTGSVSIYKMGRNEQENERLFLEREINPSGQVSGNSLFGESVAIDVPSSPALPMIAVIGEPGRRGSATVTPPADDNGDPTKNINVGSVYVLKGDGDRKTSSGKALVRWDLVAFSENIYDGADVVPAITNARKGGNFGKSVSISGDKIIVGQPGGASGDVFVYKYKLVNTDTYYYGKKNANENQPRKESRIKLDLVRTIKSPTNTSNGKFGNSVSNSDGYVMIGEPDANLPVGDTMKLVGSAFITAI
tara:strand:+ start:1165 stop:3786 length:2622 start_codon:yes stop_codon:yes gene_type:complete